jgi:hypothetical protein
MIEEFKTDLRFHPGWDSQDTTGLDNDAETNAHDAETGAAIGAVSGAVIGAMAGGAVGAVVGGVLGGIGAGAGVAAVERFEHGVIAEAPAELTHPAAADDDRDAMTSPYPGGAGRREVVQVNGGVVYDMSDAAVAADAGAYPNASSGRIAADAGATEVRTDDEDWRSEQDGTTTFRLHGNSDATRVSVAGTFNDWSAAVNPMRYVDGLWIAEIILSPGKHQYRFVVDGSWISDPHNPDNVEDGEGHLNSVVIVDHDVVQAPSTPVTQSTMGKMY